MSNHYKNFQDASDSNYSLLNELFGTSKTFKLIKPTRNNSVYDGLLLTEKDGKKLAIFIEVKRRQFDKQYLRTQYNNEFYIEKLKIDNLRKHTKRMQPDPNRIIKIWFLCKTSDGFLCIYDITDKKYKYISVLSNKVTYANDVEKIMKKRALLPISDAFYTKQTKILN